MGRHRQQGASCSYGTPWSRSLVCVFSDGTRLVSAGDDQTVRLWDASTGEQLAVLLSGPDGWAMLRHDGRYKSGGSIAGLFWYAIGYDRFLPGSLDRWFPTLQPLADDEPSFRNNSAIEE